MKIFKFGKGSYYGVGDVALFQLWHEKELDRLRALNAQLLEAFKQLRKDIEAERDDEMRRVIAAGGTGYNKAFDRGLVIADRCLIHAKGFEGRAIALAEKESKK